jgi:hypothetical protein
MIEWRFSDLGPQLHAGPLAPKGRPHIGTAKPALGIEPDPDVIRRFLMI